MEEHSHLADASAGPERSGSTGRLLRPLQVGAVALVAALLALLVWRVVAQQRGPDLVAAIRAGKRPPAPAFNLPVLWPVTATWPPPLLSAVDQGRLTLAALRGRPVVVNFWASWCVPCRLEAPLLARAARAHAGKVVFLGIDVQDLEGDGRDFLRRYKVDYVSLRDTSNSTYDAYGLTGVPETYYLDASGRAVAHSPGQVTAHDLNAGIAAIAPR
jgi:cytochrome c biogenesis protein CcmG/thiol:disulfide interchange protein DsbE